MSLSSRSMFVSLTQRVWQATASDRTLAKGVEVSSNAETRTMRVVKQLAPTDYLLPISRLVRLGRDQHERMTLRSFEKGQQLLATALFDEYAAVQAKIKDAFYQEVENFLTIYPAIIQRAPARLGSGYRAKDFPTADAIRGYFEYSIKFSPVPESGNWLLDGVSQDDINKLRAEIETEKNEMFREATKEIYERATKVLENVVNQAAEYDEEQFNGGRLKEPVINAVKDMAALMLEMNIIGDPVLSAVGQEMIEKFDNLDGKTLRGSALERAALVKSAGSLLKKLKAGL